VGKTFGWPGGTTTKKKDSDNVKSYRGNERKVKKEKGAKQGREMGVMHICEDPYKGPKDGSGRVRRKTFWGDKGFRAGMELKFRPQGGAKEAVLFGGVWF